jgi:hypothetical protein
MKYSYKDIEKLVLSNLKHECNEYKKIKPSSYMGSAYDPPYKKKKEILRRKKLKMGAIKILNGLKEIGYNNL